MHIQISQRRRRQFHSENKGKKRRFFPEADLEGCAPPFFCNHLCFYNHVQELKTKMLIEVKLIINNAPLTYVYPNTIKTCLTLNHLLLGRQ